MSTSVTDQTAISTALGRVRATFAAGTTRPRSWRAAQLTAMRTMLLTHSTEFEQALHSDLRKSPVEAQLAEIGSSIAEIDHTLRRLRGWMRPSRVRTPMSLFPATARIVPEPLGVVLIIAPWNYPLQLSISPMIGALAAGNTVVLKPSELAPATSALLARLLPAYLDAQAVTVVEGGVEETTYLLTQPFDHILYTGNGTVGRIVATAAAEHLTPITLELGGKSPVFVDETTDLAVAARRIAWAKFLNAGQTCVAPDYVLVTEAARQPLLAELTAAITEMFGADPQRGNSYGRIVNQRHFRRLRALLAEGDLVTGGGSDEADLYIEPTVLTGVTGESAVMAEEIFGPILPVLTVAGVGEAISFITARDKPLALYAFTGSAAARDRLLQETSSGALNFGIPMAHTSVSGLPFGGVGASGMGAYHGKFSFDTFTHRKPVLSKPSFPDTMRLLYPPYTDRTLKLVKRFIVRSEPLLSRRR